MNGKTAMLNHIEELIAATRTKPPMNTDNTHRQSLQQALAAVMPQEEVAEAIHRYDKLAKFGQAMAVEVTLKSIGLDEARGSVVADYLARQLTKLGSVPKPEIDGVKRVRDLLIRLNKKISDCSILVNQQDLSEYGRDKGKIQVPLSLQKQMWTYTAKANHKVGEKTFKEFGLETIGGGRTE